IERYDIPNTGNDVANMLLTYVQVSTGATGTKIATPTINDKWVAQQIAILPAATYQQQCFSSSGTYTVPDGVSSITVECWGAGGGGGTSGGGGKRGGGGGGAYARSVLNVSPESMFDYVIGSGGTAGNAGTSTTFGGTN